MIRSGELTERIEFQSLSETNENGEMVQAWTRVIEVWAHIISQRGSESFEAARQNATETIRIQTRYRDDVQTDWRIIWNGKSYNIIYVDKTQRRNGELWITAEVVGI